MPRLSGQHASLATDAICQRLNRGFLRIYEAPQPKNPETAVSGQTLLVELRYTDIAYTESIDGLAQANILPDIAIATGSAAWARHLEADGETAVFDSSVDTAKADLILDNVDIDIGSPVAITGFTFRTKRN